MMANKEATHEVTHGSLYLSVGGRLQEIPRGTPVHLSAKAADSLMKQGKVKPIANKESVDVGGDDLRAKAAELGIEVNSRWGDKRLTEEIEKVEAANAALG